MQFLDKMERAILAVLKWALIILLIAVTISVSWGVFTRYVLNAAAQWPFEFSGFVLVWITFLGSAYALFNGKHIRFETLFDLLPRPMKLVVTTIFNSTMIIFVLYLSYYGYFLMMRSFGNETVSLPLSKGFFYSIIPIGGALMALALIFDTIKTFKGQEKVETKIDEERLI